MTETEQRLAHVLNQIAVAEANPTQENTVLLGLLFRPQERQLQTMLEAEQSAM